MIHTIGVSFTAEMLAKAAYEETIGRATAWLRGPRKTPQDTVDRRRWPPTTRRSCARRRGTSIRSSAKARELWAAPVGTVVRGWERRLGIGLEFQAKAAYAKVIAGAVAATAPAQLVIRSVVSGLDAAALGAHCRTSRSIGGRGGRHRDRDAALRSVHAHPRRHRPTGRRDPRDRRQRRDHGER